MIQANTKEEALGFVLWMLVVCGLKKVRLLVMPPAYFMEDTGLIVESDTSLFVLLYWRDMILGV